MRAIHKRRKIGPSVSAVWTKVTKAIKTVHCRRYSMTGAAVSTKPERRRSKLLLKEAIIRKVLSARENGSHCVMKERRFFIV